MSRDKFRVWSNRVVTKIHSVMAPKKMNMTTYHTFNYMIIMYNCYFTKKEYI